MLAVFECEGVRWGLPWLEKEGGLLLEYALLYLFPADTWEDGGGGWNWKSLLTPVPVYQIRKQFLDGQGASIH